MQVFNRPVGKGFTAIAVSPGVIATDMLIRVLGADANKHDAPNVWMKRAVPFFLKLTAKDNGQSLRIG